MRALEAKDFLVQQTTEQAALENVPLSDLEKRMMYFTETDECPEDPIALNDAFEAEYDTDEYEAKISKLMHHAYLRIKKENPETFHRWKGAMSELSKGDHYILVFCQDGCPARPIPVSLKFPILETIAIVLLPVLVFAFLEVYYGGSSGYGHGRFWAPTGVHRSMPPWLQRLFLVLLVGLYVYGLLPWILKKPSPGLAAVLSKLFHKQSRGSSR